MSTTRVSRHLDASPDAVYRALVDPAAVQRWMVPDGMSSEVHEFDARVGGSFRISLTYDTDLGTGKTSSTTDTFHGRFVELVPGRRVVQRIEFETDDPDMMGTMTITYTLTSDGDGTLLEGVHDDLPPGVAPADNEAGWSMSIDKLARLVEQLDP